MERVSLSVERSDAEACAPPAAPPRASATKTAAWVVVGVLALSATVALAAAAARGSSARPVRLLIIGDWGRRGKYNQSEVAFALGAAAAAGRPPAAVLSTGDNFYEVGGMRGRENGSSGVRGLRFQLPSSSGRPRRHPPRHHPPPPPPQAGLFSTADPAFDAHFSEVYTHPALDAVPWKAVLGNHDWGEQRSGANLASPPPCDPDAADTAAGATCAFGPGPQLDPALAARDARWAAARSGAWFVPDSAGVGGLSIHFFDSSPHITAYRDEPWAATSGLAAASALAAGDTAALASSLLASTAKWRIVLCHHPPASLASARGADLAPPLASAFASAAAGGARVALVASGHDHTLQWLPAPGAAEAAAAAAGKEQGPSSLSPDFPPILISGAGSESWKDGKAAKTLATASNGGPDGAWGVQESGFADCSIGRNAAACDFVGIDGRVLHSAHFGRP